MSQLPRNIRFLEIASLAGSLLMASAVALVWFFGAEGPVPIHFNARGEADGWAPREQVALIMAAAAAVAVFTFLTLSRIARGPRVRNFSPANWSSLAMGWVIGIVFPVLVVGLMAGVALGWTPTADDGMPRGIMAVVSLVFAVVGGLIGKTSPNPVVGVRTYWSKRSRLAWDKSNRLAGRAYFIIGLVGLVAAPFMPMPAGMLIVVAAVLVTSAWAIYESFRVWRTDPDRLP
ncbi:SdpI family protein [Caulobacter segnis]|uniref:SdpI family protein n=1 Tax=Caulobacter segnis TaxID=88688 RepID=UPI00240FBEE4|nr:SdpI family protein [Caulobacter segnis]MDG2521403.1 SdpI family protein [Caulobacter segnis]